MGFGLHTLLQPTYTHIPLPVHSQSELLPVQLEVPPAPTAMSPAHFLPLALGGREGEGCVSLFSPTAFTLTGQHTHTERGKLAELRGPVPSPAQHRMVPDGRAQGALIPHPHTGLLEQVFLSRPTWVPGSIPPCWEVPIAHGPGRGVMELEIKGVGATIPDHRHLWGRGQERQLRPRSFRRRVGGMAARAQPYPMLRA